MSDDPKGFFVSLPSLTRFERAEDNIRGISFQLKTDGVRYFHVVDSPRMKKEIRDISTQYSSMGLVRGSRLCLSQEDTRRAHGRLIAHARAFYPEFLIPEDSVGSPYSWVAFPMLGAAMKDSMRTAPMGVNLQVASGLRAFSVEDMTGRIFGEAPKQLQAAVAKSLSSEPGVVNIDNLTLASLLRGYLPPNEMVEILRMDLRQYHGWMQQIDKQAANAIRLLLRRFNPKRLLRLIMSITEHHRGDMLLRDCASQYASARATHPDVRMDLNRQFRSLEELHETITREFRKLQNANEQITYPEQSMMSVLGHVALVGGARLVWPECTHDLLDWANMMNNCIYSYGKNAAAGRCLLFAVLDGDGKMAVNIMISGKRVVQCYGPSNSHIEDEALLEDIFDKLLHVDLINPEEDHKIWLRRRWEIGGY